MGERLPCKQEVTSSNLVISIGFQKESNVYLENCIQREISYENKRVELIQQDIRGNVNNIIKKQTITNACNAIHV